MLWKLISLLLSIFVFAIVVNLFAGLIRIAIGWQIGLIVLAVTLIIVLWSMSQSIA